MGLMDSIKNMAGQQGGPVDGQVGRLPGSTLSTVAGGLMQALDEHPGGLAGVLNNFQQNGMGDHVQNWATGDQQSATPDQIQQGLGSSGFIDKVAERAGVSPQVAKVAMAALLPVVISHFTRGGQQAAPQSGFGGMASQILGRLL